MLRTTWLSARNDLRLLAKDPVVLLMLLLAPVVIITVAGYSLGAIYGGAPHERMLPVVDRDGGEVATRLVAALRDESSVRVVSLPDADAARRLVARADGPALAIEIPPGTTAAMRAGRSPRLVLYVDPAKRIEVNALEVRLAALCGRVGDAARAAAEAHLARTQADLRRTLGDAARALRDERARVRGELEAARATTDRALRAAVADAARGIEAQMRAREERAWADLDAELQVRRARLDELRARLGELRASEQAFADWLARVRELAGRHAADVPPPPAFPTLPSDAELAALAGPVARPRTERPVVPVRGLAAPTVALPAVDPPDPPAALDGAEEVRFERLPGALGLVEEPAGPGADVAVNAFDQYVPGFGITFLLIGMMLGIALALFDEREWGTLQRLEASGAPLAGLLLGKLATRFAVGVVQMVVLFAVGRVLFDISLGRTPAALLLPTAGISFAAAALGLIVPAIAHAHDAVMPLGTMTSMAMSAVGGCWWPLGFEPSWMRAIARALPTTWAMQAYNDLMIRQAPWRAALWPTAATLGLGACYLAVGIALNVRRTGQ